MNKTNRTKHLPTFALMLAAMIWGQALVTVQIALDNGFSEGLMLFGRLQ